MCVGLVTHFAEVWFVRRVNVHVFLSVAAVCKPSVTTFKLTLERLLPCMCSLVYLQVFRPCEDLSTAREGTWKRFFPGVHPNVVNQFVFRLERFALPGALFPEADVVGLLRSTDMLHRDVCDQLVHGAKSFVATLLWVAELLGVDPLADELLLDALLPHVAEKGTGVMVGCHVHPHVHIHGTVLVVELCGRVGVGPRAGDLMVLIGASENFSG